LHSVQHTAAAINNIDHVVGDCENTSGYRRAYLYDGNDLQDLGVLGDSEYLDSYAFDINNSNQVVGRSELTASNWRAFIYDNGVMENIGALHAYSSAFGINDKGHVVGTSYTPEQQYHAFIYKNDEMEDLNDLVSDWGNWDPSGYLSYAYDINEDGQIVGYGYTYNGDRHAFRLDPILMPNP
jgi:probable HAF family extracellular repeat protein